VQKWFVYVLYSLTTGKLYTGISTSPARRLEKHNAGTGAKATRVGRPWKIVYCETMSSKSAALKREFAVKQLKRAQKLVLVGLAA
jgi:putative endonuclease